MKRSSEHYPRMAKEDQTNLKLCGSWLTDIGQLDTAGNFIHTPNPGSAYMGVYRIYWTSKN